MEKFPQDFNEYQDKEVLEQFLEYMTLSVCDTELTQAWEQFTLLEEPEAIELKIGDGEEVLGWLTGKVGEGFGDGFHQGVLQSFGLNPGLDCSQVR